MEKFTARGLPQSQLFWSLLLQVDQSSRQPGSRLVGGDLFSAFPFICSFLGGSLVNKMLFFLRFPHPFTSLTVIL
jgi:hypothetical protein